MCSIVVTTCPDRECARELSMKILQKSLAACVQEDEIVSSYIWNGRIVTEPEVRLTIKCKKIMVREIFGLIKDNHPYEIPEIIELEIADGDREYLKWIRDKN